MLDFAFAVSVGLWLKWKCVAGGGSNRDAVG